jgi:predicted RNase H-like nuclease (RuvC/YqgF family)
VARRKQTNNSNSMDQLLAETSEAVGRLIRENRDLRSENVRLQREVARLSQGWADIKRLARSAPRARRSR